MTWSYELRKVIIPEKPKNYVVQVVSHSRNPDQSLQVKFFTNAKAAFVDVI